MTNKEIVQAMRLCLNKEGDCRTCNLLNVDQCVKHLVRAAADLIERLTAENAELREKQRWIPVTERLPEKQAWYHVAIRDKKQCGLLSSKICTPWERQRISGMKSVFARRTGGQNGKNLLRGRRSQKRRKETQNENLHGR